MPRSTMSGERTYTFTVEGDGDFPIDMLRYDQCWPYYSEDTGAIRRDNRRRIVLESCSAQMPTRRRWESVGWRVVEVGYPDAETSRRIA